ncbi:MAG: DUF3142 domain-containing protein [Candidatus Hydrogenedentes bacterium]|nr:DUF3142 domain-containing protein [Candidatus Hydrogenedentota bacterium]
MELSRKDALWYATALALAVAIGALVWLRAPQAPPPKPVVSAYYVWQLQWTDEVRAAVRTADASANAFMVLAGEVNPNGGDLRVQRGHPDWDALARVHAPITVVFRANAALADALQGGARESTVDFVADAIEDVLADAAAKGATVRGVQLDYDCPSAKLGAYAELIAALRPRFARTEMSITALPTWLKWREFAGLVRAVDYYVLQVHSIERPSAIDDAITLCDTARVPGYLRRAAAIGTPFYLALPTYGYRFVFDANGAVTAIAAEGPAPALASGQRIRTVMADPSAIAQVVRDVRARPPHGLLGFVWFRLPVASDDLNWPWPTLEAVRDGRDS